MITILAIDTIKEQCIKSLIETFQQRLTNKLYIKILELKSEKKYYEQNYNLAKDIETQRLIDQVPDNSYLVTLDEQGVLMNSMALSSLIYQTLNHQHLTFILGGTYGLTEKAIKKAQLVLALSKMTLTHEFARLFLMEQLYRAYTINNHIKYHH